MLNGWVLLTCLKLKCNTCNYVKNINSYRVFEKNVAEPNSDGDFVLYWMQINRRFQYNYALDYAIGWANKLGKPLLIVEDLVCNYSWASDRTHTFMMQGMAEQLAEADEKGFNFLPLVESDKDQAIRIHEQLWKRAALLVTDEYPVYLMRERNESLPERMDIPYFTVDSNGLIPLKITDKAPYSAYFFRKVMQKHFVECYTHPPEELPFEELDNRDPVSFDDNEKQFKEKSREALANLKSFISKLDIRHDVRPIGLEGTRRAALQRMHDFIGHELMRYEENRNDPDREATSGLSPWLHFGMISEYEIVKAALDRQPEGWDLDRISYNKGSKGAFFNGDENIAGFLDEVITWREVGFHYAHHDPNYFLFESLPDWVQETLNDHRDDPREYIYSFEEFEQAQTHDEIWNAAQRQLVSEGIIHNYLRMLWGKKILEWTPDPETALEYMIELNNLYAIDGRDPNSYSGIFWVLGRFDRPWQERPVYGKIRYMTSESTRKKVKLKEYLERFGPQKGLFDWE